MMKLVFLTLISFLSFSSAAAHTSAPSDAADAADAAVAVVDTAVVEIILPEGADECTAISVSNDTLGFGMAGKLDLEFAGEIPAISWQDLETSESWLTLADLTDGQNTNSLAYEMRAYRLNPFRIKVGSMLSQVIHLTGSTGDLNETAAIRMPGVWRARWWLIILAVLILSAIFVSVYLIWKRRLKLDVLQQWEPAPPAWLAVAIDLRQLLSGQYPSPESVREFMDRLAGISRSYLAGRYLVPAGEMTGREILARCLLKGHDSRSLRRLILILEGLDNQRYNPELPSGSWSREQAVELFKAIEEVRILPRYTTVDAKLLIEAEKAWAWLEQPENHPAGQVPTGGGV